MNLNHLFKAHDIKLPFSRIKLVRHKFKLEERKLIEKYDEAFMCTQSIQRKSVFQNFEYILSFMSDEDNNTIFKGVFKIIGEQKFSLDKIRSMNYEIQKSYRKFLKTHYWYDQIKLPDLKEYEDRLVLNWGKGNLAWHQKYKIDKPKEIIAIRPRGYFREFPGYLNFSLSRNELKNLFKNSDANEVWRTILSKINAVYLILDEKTGGQYVGSAYGRGGLWGRWENYYKTMHGDNKLLKELLKSGKSSVDNFRYSILEVLSSTLTKEEVIKRESAIKIKLGSRAHGLN